MWGWETVGLSTVELRQWGQRQCCCQLLKPEPEQDIIKRHFSFNAWPDVAKYALLAGLERCTGLTHLKLNQNKIVCLQHLHPLRQLR